jgi:hypothetical protein
METMKNTIVHPTRGKLVCKIYDNGGETVDRYTVLFKARMYGGKLYWPYFSASENPFHPLGYWQYGLSDHPIDGKHLGHRVKFDALPNDMQRYIKNCI